MLGAKVLEVADRLGHHEVMPALRALVEVLARTGSVQQAIALADKVLLEARFSQRDGFCDALADVAVAIAAVDHGDTLAAVYRAMVDIDSWWQHNDRS